MLMQWCPLCITGRGDGKPYTFYQGSNYYAMEENLIMWGNVQ